MMVTDSLKRCPAAPVFLLRSEPARSTRWNLERTVSAALAARRSTSTWSGLGLGLGLGLGVRVRAEREGLPGAVAVETHTHGTRYDGVLREEPPHPLLVRVRVRVRLRARLRARVRACTSSRVEASLDRKTSPG